MPAPHTTFTRPLRSPLSQGLLWMFCMGLLLSSSAAADSDLDGLQIMQEVVRRHEYYPYTFERQSMILQDKSGNRDVRRLRRYSRLEEDGRLHFLLVFDQPAEIRGVVLLATRYPSGKIDNGMYLPAFGNEIKNSSGDNRNSPFLGTDFTVQDMTPEIIDDFNYRREDEQKIGNIPHYVISAHPKTAAVEQATGYSLRRFYVRQDNFFVVRTDYYDHEGRLFKRRTQHDLKQVDGPMWRANMVLMQGLREHHLSLLKIEQRVFSKDYVPAELFSRDYILANRHIAQTTAENDDEVPDELEFSDRENEILEKWMNQ